MSLTEDEMMYKRSILGLISAFVLLVVFATPSSAFALEKQFIRYDFVSGTSQGQRVTFVDQKFRDYASQGLTGVIVQASNSGFIVLEGNGSTVSAELDELKKETILENVRSVDSKQLSSPTMSDLRTHTEVDPRGFADTPNSDSPKRVYVRIEFASGVDQKATLDEYFDDIAADGLGGALVEGPGVGWLPTVLEGRSGEVDDWITKMKYDARFQTVEVLESVDPAALVFPDLWSHSSDDTRDTTK